MSLLKLSWMNTLLQVVLSRRDYFIIVRREGMETPNASQEDKWICLSCVGDGMFRSVIYETLILGD